MVTILLVVAFPNQMQYFKIFSLNVIYQGVTEGGFIERLIFMSIKIQQTNVWLKNECAFHGHSMMRN